MKSPISTFYNDTYSGDLSKPSNIAPYQKCLASVVSDLSNMLVTVDESIHHFKDFWNLKFYDGGSLVNYLNAHDAVVLATLLDFAKIRYITEYQQKDIGIRFYASLTEDEVVVDIVKYCSVDRTEPNNFATLEHRINGPVNDTLCLTGFANIINIAQRLSNHVIDITSVKYN